ncbi:MAG: hypothetical protein ACREQ5_22340, partial [Candidatus Dormibacteria bacterium]
RSLPRRPDMTRDEGGAAVDDELTETLQALLASIAEMGGVLEEQLARLIEDQRAHSPFAYLMESGGAVE